MNPETAYVKIVLRDNRERRVRIVGMRANAKCRKPLNGTLFLAPPQGEQESVPMVFTLDEREPVAKTGGTGGGYFSRKTISLKHGEDVVIEAAAITSKHYCEFTLEMDVLDEGRLASQTIDDNGDRFRVTALYRKPPLGVVDVGKYRCGLQDDEPAVTDRCAVGRGGRVPAAASLAGALPGKSPHIG